MAAKAADLVGRERELAAIAEFLEADAAACAVVIEGEPGIGKTTVWEAAVTAAAEQGFQPLRARPGGSEAKLAFSGLADLLGEALPGVLSALRALSTAAPLLVAIDDAQWLDRSSAAALEYAARRLHAKPVALLIA